MKPLFTFFVFFLFQFYISEAQTKLNTELIRLQSSHLSSKPINILVLVKHNTEISFVGITDYQIHYKISNIYAISTSLEAIKKLSEQKNVLRIEYTEHHLKLMDDTSDVRNRINPVKSGLLPLTQAYDGANIIVGIIDSGTDFSHPDFNDISGNSRIKYLWDMTKPVAANTPTTFGYGQEWTNTEIDLGLCTHDDTPHFGHGTASSGIAAGNGLAIHKYAGAAPKADLVVVALDFTRVGFTIADAVQYIVAKANVLNKPFVINASVGEYYGSHDGTDLEAKIIDGMVTGSGKCLIASAGNAGSVPFHVGYNINSIDTNFTWIKSTSSAINLSEYADTLQIKNVKYTIGVNNLGFTNLGNIGFKSYNYSLGTLKRDTIFNGVNRIGIVECVSSINTFGVYELNISIKPDSLNYLWRIEHNGIGRIDSWNFDYVTTGLPSIGIYPKINKYKIADTTQSIVSSFQCSDEVITVANYVNRNHYIDINGNVQTTTETPGEIAVSSSVGPTRNNKIKPDVAATGATLLASAAMGLIPGLISAAPYVIAQGGYHITAGGTSASSPVVAGLAALYLQKNPTATNQQIKQAIINCAYVDAFVNLPIPNFRWGFGKLDGFKAMTCGLITTNISLLDNDGSLKLFPNPVEKKANILFESNELKTIRILNSSGQTILLEKIQSNTYLLNSENLTPGVYLIISEEKEQINKLKFLIL